MQANPKQQEAIDHLNGPMLIIAGAGSGKTATLTKRIEEMTTNKGIPAQNILAVTFTNKAASEMKSRIGKALKYEGNTNFYARGNFPTIGTFHSIGVFFIKEYLNFAEKNSELIIENLGIKKDFLIYDESDKVSILKGIITEKLKLNEKEFPARQVAFFISDAKNKLIGPNEYSEFVDSVMKKNVSDAYKIYEERKTQNNGIDFDDILLKTLKILQKREILEIFWERYKYIMVDEYQDTNEAQYQIIKLLAEKYRNLAVVGDDAQSIYSWRGADMRNILNFKKDYPDAKIIKLEQNYRSTGTILKGANAVIKNNKNAIEKNLWTENVEGEKIHLIEASNDSEEGRYIGNLIKEKNSDGGKFSDNLILYRTNAQSRQIEESFIRNGIPYKIIGGLKFYDRKEIKDIMAYLKAIFSITDSVSIKRIINVPSRKIGSRTIEVLDLYNISFGLNYLDIIRNSSEIEELGNAAKLALENFYLIMQNALDKSHQIPVSELIEYIIKKIGYKDYLEKEFSKEEKESKLENLEELKNVASNYDYLPGRESLSSFLEEVSLISEAEKTGENEEDFVTLMTIHTAKGLEQERVFVVGLEEGILPHARSVFDQKELEEERRLMYVAMTRAKKELYISKARERFNFGSFTQNPPSRFLKEIPEELLEKIIPDLGFSFEFGQNKFSSDFENSKIIRKVVAKKTENDLSQFSVGNFVIHESLGRGKIVELSEYGIASIQFKDKIRKMSLKIAPVVRENN